MIVLMDIDGVLIKSFDNDKNIFNWQKNIENDLKISPQQLLNHLFNEEWADIIVGRAPLEKGVVNLLKKTESTYSYSDFVEYWFSRDCDLEPKVVKMCRELKASGINIYIGANQETNKVNYIFKKYPYFFDIFDGKFISSEVGFKKPDKKFFEFISKKLDTKYENIFFIDDSKENINSAKELGIKTFLFDENSNISDLHDLILFNK